MNKPLWIQAISTVVLAVLTGFYVWYTSSIVGKQSEQIKSQEQQFLLVNRARILSYLCVVQGDVKGGTIKIVNTGNLPAEDLEFVWIIIKVEGDEVLKIYPKPRKDDILGQDGIRIESFDKVDPEEIISIQYNSDFEYDEQTIFLIASWKYKGQGIDGFRLKDRFFLWDINRSPLSWILTGPLGATHSKVINNMKNQLKQFLEKES